MITRKRRRNSLRWQGHDYSDPGDYFITICTYQRHPFLGDIVRCQPHLSPLGKVIAYCWELVPSHYPHVEMGAFVVMPNHIHGILTLRARHDDDPRHGVSEIVRWVKGISTRHINRRRGVVGVPVWQRGFYDSVIKHPRMYEFVHQYILENPLKWEVDRLHPHHPDPFPIDDE